MFQVLFRELRERGFEVETVSGNETFIVGKKVLIPDSYAYTFPIEYAKALEKLLKIIDTLGDVEVRTEHSLDDAVLPTNTFYATAKGVVLKITEDFIEIFGGKFNGNKDDLRKLFELAELEVEDYTLFAEAIEMGAKIEFRTKKGIMDFDDGSYISFEFHHHSHERDLTFTGYGKAMKVVERFFNRVRSLSDGEIDLKECKGRICTIYLHYSLDDFYNLSDYELHFDGEILKGGKVKIYYPPNWIDDGGPTPLFRAIRETVEELPDDIEVKLEITDALRDSEDEISTAIDLIKRLSRLTKNKLSLTMAFHDSSVFVDAEIDGVGIAVLMPTEVEQPEYMNEGENKSLPELSGAKNVEKNPVKFLEIATELGIGQKDVEKVIMISVIVSNAFNVGTSFDKFEENYDIVNDDADLKISKEGSVTFNLDRIRHLPTDVAVIKSVTTVRNTLRLLNALSDLEWESAEVSYPVMTIYCCNGEIELFATATQFNLAFVGGEVFPAIPCNGGYLIKYPDGGILRVKKFISLSGTVFLETRFYGLLSTSLF